MKIRYGSDAATIALALDEGPDVGSLGSAEETLIFLHLAKTAGMTLVSIIRRQYAKSEIYEVYGHPALAAVDAFGTYPEDQRAQYRAIVGHMHLGMHKLVPGPSATITLLRDPVQLAISAYFFILNKPNHPDHETITKSGLDFAGVLRSGLLPILDNSQTRVLSTTGVPTAPYGECTREMLERAKENVDRYLEIAGVTERFDETLLMLKERFAWHNIFYTERNRSPRRPQPAQLPRATLELIEEYNQLDIELYRYVRERFEHRLAELGTPFSRRVKLFKRENAAVNSYWRLKRRVRGLRAMVETGNRGT